MSERMTYHQIEERFAGEWVVVRDFVRDDARIIKEGVVVTHTPDRAAAHRALDTFDDAFAIWFVGGPNPDFCGILSLPR
ncbi:MAG: hypothetical protein HY905_08770 [Deltaproteobacteria bacterium]|nr:hypothetical protein [Deltaproteobacteria bacterium]